MKIELLIDCISNSTKEGCDIDMIGRGQTLYKSFVSL